jgi:hypothetical protein
MKADFFITYHHNDELAARWIVSVLKEVPLQGHIHRTKIRKLFSIARSSYISVGTGSLYGEKGLGDINTYHIITLDFKQEEFHIWARRWIPERGCWGVYDNDINNTFPFPGKHH